MPTMPQTIAIPGRSPSRAAGALERARQAIKAAALRAEECIRFQPENGLPAALIRKLVKSRVAEIRR
jgi:hypothetical protein